MDEEESVMRTRHDPKAEKDLASRVLEYTEKLKSSIKRQTDFLLTSEEEDKKIRTDDIFTNLTIERGRPAKLAKTTPPEILARSPEAFKAYKEALSRGKSKNRRVLVTIVGPPRAGKTSLLKSLKGEKFDPDEDSTTGVVIQKAFCKPQKDSWFEEDKGKDDLSNNCIVECMAKNMERKKSKPVTETTATSYQAVTEMNQMNQMNQNEKDQEHEEHERGESEIKATSLQESNEIPQVSKEIQGLSENFRYTKTGQKNKDLISPKTPDSSTLRQSNLDEIPQLPKEIGDLFENYLRENESGQKTNENEISLKTLDFAGQQVYEVILPLFMSPKSIYILVHNLENNLYSDAQSKVKHGTSQRELENPLQMNHLDALEYWLSCILSYTKKQVDSIGSGIKVPPRIFVVCTHADVCEQDPPKEVAGTLCKILTRPENLYGEHVEGNVYYVNNKLSGNKEVKDESAKRLKTDVEKLSKSLPQVNEDIPISWLRFEEELSKLVEKEQKKYVAFEEAMGIATKCNVNTATKSIEFTTLLNYLHDLKTIIYFEETRTVFIDTQWLVDMFVKVITVMPFEEWKEYATYWRKLEDEGILQRALVEHVWSDIASVASDSPNTIDSLLLIMKKFSLICPWRLNEEEEEVYLVPCMLCNSKGTEDIEKLLADQKSSTMVIRFKSVHLPMGIFPRLFVALAEHGKKEWPKVRPPKLRPNFCRMYNVGEKGRLDICITSGIQTICVTVCNKNDIDGASVTTFCQSVRKLLDKIFTAMQNTCPRVENMEIEYGIRCPVCAKCEMNRKSHNIKGCKRVSCLHFVQEEELKHDRPECYEDETNPNPLIREETYSHWFPKIDKRGPVYPINPVGLDLDTMSSTEVADKVAERLQLDKLSMADPPADIQEKLQNYCRQLKKVERRDVIKELRKTLPSGMTGPLLDDDQLYQELDFKIRRDLTRALCGNDLWKCLASELGVPGDQFGYYKNQQNPAEEILEDIHKDESKRSLKVAELYDLLVKCDANALADKYL